MKKKIFAYFAIAIIFSSVLSIVAVTALTRQFYRSDMEATLKNIAHAISRDLDGTDSPDYKTLAARYSEIYSYENQQIRITFIAVDGTVKGDSDADPASMENHLGREEVTEAFETGYGSSLRYSSTVSADMLYAAVRNNDGDMLIRVAVPLVNISRINSILVNYAYLSAFLGIIAALIVAILLSSYIMKPVNKISEAALRIYEGDIAKQVDVKSSDRDINTLAFVFNNMTAKLRSVISELQEDNIKITSIIDSMNDGLLYVDGKRQVRLINKMMKQFFGLKQNENYTGFDLMDAVRNKKINEIINDSLQNGNYIEDELRVPTEKKDIVYRIYTAPVKAEAAALPGVILYIQDITSKRRLEQIRSDFVSNVTHELKTPLTSIRGFIETLKNGAIRDSAVAEKFLSIIELESERLSLLIDDILSLSEIEHGLACVNVVQCDIKVIVNDIFELLRPAADKKGVILQNDTKAGLNIITDDSKLSRLLINLVDNAIKYNKSDGIVRVYTETQKGLVSISVQDTGIGMAEDQLDRIFERFYRVDKGRSKEEGGTGLGLSIAKHLAKILNGDIRVSSEPDEGTTFTLTLPYK